MNTSVQEFLTPYTPEVRDLVLNVRTLILDVMPRAIEQIDPPSKIIAYGFGLEMADLICAIAPYTSHVNLMFSNGTRLPDPEKLLEGTGKQARHVKIKKAGDIEAPAVRALLEAAVALY